MASCQRDVPKSHYFSGSAHAVHAHCTWGRDETCPKKISASGSGCCRAADAIAQRQGARRSMLVFIVDEDPVQLRC
jgi:hypothetical protein